MTPFQAMLIGALLVIASAILSAHDNKNAMRWLMVAILYFTIAAFMQIGSLIH